MPEDRIVVSGVSGISRQREWIHHNLARDGEWYVTGDDNIRAITSLMEPYYDEPEVSIGARQEEWRARYAHRLDGAEALTRVFEDTAQHADGVGARFATFAVVDNCFFRQRKFRYVGATVAKLAMWKRDVGDSARWDHNVKCIDDYQYGADQVYHNGAVVINNYVFPQAKHYQAGGLGTYEERADKRRYDVEYLVNKYPGYFRVKDRKDFAPGTELAVRLTTRTQVEQWRKQMRAIRGDG